MRLRVATVHDKGQLATLQFDMDPLTPQDPIQASLLQSRYLVFVSHLSAKVLPSRIRVQMLLSTRTCSAIMTTLIRHEEVPHCCLL